MLCSITFAAFAAVAVPWARALPLCPVLWDPPLFHALPRLTGMGKGAHVELDRCPKTRESKSRLGGAGGVYG